MSLSEFDIVVVESSISLGSGSRRREVKSWEAFWDAPSNLNLPPKQAHLSVQSSKSREDAVRQVEGLIRQALGREA